MFTDFVLNSLNPGEVGVDFTTPGVRYETGLRRQYIDLDGRKKCTVNTGRTKFNPKSNLFEPVYEEVLVKDLRDRDIDLPVINSTTLRKDEWIQLDRQVHRAYRQRLRAWTDLMAASQIGGFNAMGKMVLEYETESDGGEAQVDMDGMTEGRGDSTRFQLEGTPLPITHSDFWFSQRRLTISRNSGVGLDVRQAERAGRRIAEKIEKTLIGMVTGVTYGAATEYSRAPTVYGYTNFPERATYTSVTAPSGGGWKPSDTVGQVLAMRDLLYDAGCYGPYMLYHSKDWDRYLDNDYYALATSGMTSPNQTLRQRLQSIENISSVRRLDFFTSTFNLLLVQMTSDVAQAINGMEPTTVQWESQGGMRVNFKVLAIQVPRLLADFNGNCGICHGTTS